MSNVIGKFKKYRSTCYKSWKVIEILDSKQKRYLRKFIHIKLIFNDLLDNIFLLDNNYKNIYNHIRYLLIFLKIEKIVTSLSSG